MRIAFDIDDTLWKLVDDEGTRIEGVGTVCNCGAPLKQCPDEIMMAIAHQLVLDADNEVFVWSAGGIDHAQRFLDRDAPAWKSLGVKAIDKRAGHDIDICFDDQDVDLAKVNVRVKREHADHWD